MGYYYKPPVNFTNFSIGVSGAANAEPVERTTSAWTNANLQPGQKTAPTILNLFKNG